MTKQKKLRGLTGIQNEKVPFTHQQILDALYYLEDMMDRTNIPFFLLEGAAKQVSDNVPYLSLNQIDAGIEEKNLQITGIGTLKMVFPKLEIDQNTVSFEYHGVPIVIWIVHKNWKFFQNPDTVFYSTCNFRIPNPFKNYWKSRFLIK
jgi:hypothetical protein